MDDRLKEAVTIAGERGIVMLEASRADLDRLTDDAIHQGIALQVPPYEYADPDQLMARAAGRLEKPLLVALDGITDPRNLGAIVRSTAAFAGTASSCRRRAAAMTAAAWKTSAGAAARIRESSTSCGRAGLRSGVCSSWASTWTATSGCRVSRSRTHPSAWSWAPGAGAVRLVRDVCDQIVSIPIAASTESLNAGVAAAVSLYGIARVRGRNRPEAGPD